LKLPRVYEPDKYEADIYSLWEKKNAFTPVSRGGEGYFSLVLPPVNANGNLHIGHALTVAIEDTLARYWRQKGRSTLYLPGADHAGFETQVVYERLLEKEGRSRFDFSRDELYSQIWSFVGKNKQNMEAQIRALGTSVDWSRFTYTLDNKVVEASYQTFHKMWDEGMIYRGNRIVNYCTFHRTSFSDIEVIHEEEETKLWYIAYPFKDDSGEVVIATTRPETKLGQSALMVHPEDERHKELIGKEVIQPLVPDKPIQIIADKYVDKEFGTGVVTVTPAHDPNDFEVAQRHNLPAIELITPEGKMSDNVPEKFKGLTVMEARKATEETLREKGFLRKVEDYVHSVGKCYKCGTIIEPMLREQWFVKMQPLAKRAVESLKRGEVTFYPKSKLQQTIRYLEQVKDWNISRQIAWGIPIPAFQNEADPDDWIFDTRVKEKVIEVNGKLYRRDPDVFDTWFSSGQWPYVTLGYTESQDFKQFYPLSLMETGGEILYQWVARMILLGLYRTGKVPFKNVYIHGYVLAEDGQKMSKSLGNVIDPLEIIGESGSDALRMGLLSGRRPGVNQGYHPAKIIGGRNFANKFWNVARFIEARVDDNHHSLPEVAPKSSADHWILNRYSDILSKTEQALENYRLSEAYELVYGFVWHDLADWYIEASKSEANTSLMAYLLEGSLKIAHPFAPFLTETIWQTLAWEEGTLLATQPWTPALEFDKQKAAEFEELVAIISEARGVIKALSLAKPILFFEHFPLLEQEAGLVVELTKAGEAKKEKGKGIKLTNTSHMVWIEVEPQKAREFLVSLEEKASMRQERVANLESRLANKEYVEKAPQALVEETRRQLAEERILLDRVQQELDSFKKASADIKS
jgi:valyl-tRNA synthetase